MKVNDLVILTFLFILKIATLNFQKTAIFNYMYVALKVISV